MGKKDSRMEDAVYINGDYFVLKENSEYTVCNIEGCGRGLYHVGDTYDNLGMAKTMADFWQSGGHWSVRPDMEKNDGI